MSAAKLISIGEDAKALKWSADELALALRLRSEGLTASAIADALSAAGYAPRDGKRVSIKLRALEAV
jgi:hypothetical protein